MPSADLQKRFIVFVIFAGVTTLILIALPFVEGGLREYVLSQFGLDIVEGKVVSTDGVAPSMMTDTMISLVINLFHIAKIFLWMALVISIVRFVAYLLLKTAFRTSGQSEISSLLKTVISIIVYIVAFFVIFQSQYPGVQLAPPSRPLAEGMRRTYDWIATQHRLAA